MVKIMNELQFNSHAELENNSFIFFTTTHAKREYLGVTYAISFFFFFSFVSIVNHLEPFRQLLKRKKKYANQFEYIMRWDAFNDFVCHTKISFPFQIFRQKLRWIAKRTHTSFRFFFILSNVYNLPMESEWLMAVDRDSYIQSKITVCYLKSKAFTILEILLSHSNGIEITHTFSNYSYNQRNSCASLSIYMAFLINF